MNSLLNKKVFLDINVILDILLKREKLYKAPALIFKAVENGKINGLICSLSFPTLFYILSKELGKDKAVILLNKIRLIFNISLVDEKIIDKSLVSGFKDFEDAIQYYSALIARADYLITRNIKDFKSTGIPVISPEEFIALDMKIFTLKF
jgi:predicted nucleic acid-binding protein